MELLTGLLLALTPPRDRPPDRPPDRPRDDRGDVPGWVLVTIMTAGLVVVIWQLGEEQLTAMLQAALDQVR